MTVIGRDHTAPERSISPRRCSPVLLRLLAVSFDFALEGSIGSPSSTCANMNKLSPPLRSRMTALAAEVGHHWRFPIAKRYSRMHIWETALASMVRFSWVVAWILLLTRRVRHLPNDHAVRQDLFQGWSCSGDPTSDQPWLSDRRCECEPRAGGICFYPDGRTFRPGTCGYCCHDPLRYFGWQCAGLPAAAAGQVGAQIHCGEGLRDT